MRPHVLMLYFRHVVEVHKLLWTYCVITPHFATNISNKTRFSVHKKNMSNKMYNYKPKKESQNQNWLSSLGTRLACYIPEKDMMEISYFSNLVGWQLNLTTSCCVAFAIFMFTCSPCARRLLIAIWRLALWWCVTTFAVPWHCFLSVLWRDIWRTQKKIESEDS